MKLIKNLLLAGALTAAGILYSGNSNAEDKTKVTAETMLLEDLSTDTRLEIEREGLQAAVEQKTGDAYQTLVGFRTPKFKGLEFRQTGILEYGEDFNGAFNSNLFYDIPKTKLRVGVGGGASFPDNDFITHANLSYSGDKLTTVWDLLYDSQSNTFDGRGFASADFGPFYVSIGKAKGSKLVSYAGKANKNGFSTVIENRYDYSDNSSLHALIFNWNSTYDNKELDFEINLNTAGDGLDDFLFDPTIGWKPMFNKYGEYGIALAVVRDDNQLDGSVSFACNPDNKSDFFVEAGLGYTYDYEEDDDVNASLTLGTKLGPVDVVMGTKASFIERDLSLWFMASSSFDI